MNTTLVPFLVSVALSAGGEKTRLDGFMRELAVLNVHPATRRDAIWNLVYLSDGHGGLAERRTDRALMMYSRPTVAEAILAAMDAEIRFHQPDPPDELSAEDQWSIEDFHLMMLELLGDRRITPKLAARVLAARTHPSRFRLARAAHALGDPAPFKVLAEAFRAGKVPTAEAWEFHAVLADLLAVGTPEADRALFALANPKHPAHKAIVAEVADGAAYLWGECRYRHPFWLAVLRTALDDRTPTGAMYTINGDSVSWTSATGKGSVSRSSLPEYLADPAKRRGVASERVCDIAAHQLCGVTIGLPAYHALVKDADARLAAVKVAFDRFAGKYRMATDAEQYGLELASWRGAFFVPDIRPLGRAATAADVSAGTAIFHLNGRGAPVPIPGPGVVTLRGKGERGLVVQAERGPDGQVVCGVVTRGGLRTVRAAELTDFQTFAELDRWEKLRLSRGPRLKWGNVPAFGFPLNFNPNGFKW